MKRFAAVLFAVVAFASVSCGSTDSTSDKAAPSQDDTMVDVQEKAEDLEQKGDVETFISETTIFCDGETPRALTTVTATYDPSVNGFQLYYEIHDIDHGDVMLDFASEDYVGNSMQLRPVSLSSSLAGQRIKYLFVIPSSGIAREYESEPVEIPAC